MNSKRKKENAFKLELIKIKNWCKEHKWLIIITLGIAAIVITALVVLSNRKIQIDIPKVNSTKKLDVDNLLNDDLNNSEYYKLKGEREKVRLNPKLYGDCWQAKLWEYDEKIRKANNPYDDYCKSLSNEDLKNKKMELSKYFSNFEKTYNRKGIKFEEYKKDPLYIDIDRKHDLFDSIALELQKRDVEANPDKYPIHREHGWYLPNDE